MFHRILQRWKKTLANSNFNFHSFHQWQQQQQEIIGMTIKTTTTTIGIGCYFYFYLFYNNNNCATIYVPTNNNDINNGVSNNNDSISSIFTQQQLQRWIEDIVLQPRLLFNNSNTILGYSYNYYNNMIKRTSCSSWIPSSISSSVLQKSISVQPKQQEVVNDNNDDDDGNQNNNDNISFYSPQLPIHIIRPNNNLEIAFDKRTRNAIYVQHRIVLCSSNTSSRNNNSNSNTSKSPPEYSASTSTVDDEYDNNEEEDVNDDDSNSITGSSTTSSNDTKEQNQSAVTIAADRHQVTTTKKTRQRYNFKEDISLLEQYRSRNSYYHLSGYDRGHLAPAGDFVFIMNEHNTNNSKQIEEQEEEQKQQFLKEIEDTYNLCNISPQNSIMNRTIWSYLEYLIRKVTRTVYYDSILKNNSRDNNSTITVTTYITTGPLWIPSQQLSDKLFVYQYNAIGIVPSLIHVPTHFYKAFIIVVSTTSSSLSDNDDNSNDNNNKQSDTIVKYGCFVIPNDDSCKTTTKNQSFSSITDYIVTWYDLETITGLTFYSNIITNEWKQNADKVTQSIIQATRRKKRQQQQQLPLLLLTAANQSSSGSSSSSSKLNNVSSLSSSSTIMSKWDSKSCTHFCDNNACERSYSKEKKTK